MMAYTVVVTDSGFPDLNQERAVLEPLGFQFVTGQATSSAEVARLCIDADAVLTQWAPIDAEAIRAMRKCKIIVRYGIGVDNVDLQAAKECGIPVVNVPDYAIEEVADHALTLLLGIVRKLPQVAGRVRAGIWEIAPCRPIVGLQGRRLGLAGFGNIARAVARRAQAFGIEVAAYDPFLGDDIFYKHGVRHVGWDELIGQSDFISVHLPLTAQTRHTFNKETFERMKHSAFLVNTSRGGVISTEDLADALHAGKIAGAALDVLEEEPIQPGNRLLELDSCIVTSHMAWYSEASLLKLQHYAALEIERIFTGQRPKHIVNGVDV
ncbi:C-terminal binding protein [Cohnella abietis]|uniref:Dehydrogenase n=1 Tax=Cohnella abietis TaxID=2507935 RepID=A0A3T1DAD3_9BACL|nr:C-terminal binding protein [Cohnella abietis]BBI35033.1 dehydrogenase [Cohnella abietis]